MNLGGTCSGGEVAGYHGDTGSTGKYKAVLFKIAFPSRSLGTRRKGQSVAVEDVVWTREFLGNSVHCAGIGRWKYETDDQTPRCLSDGPENQFGARWGLVFRDSCWRAFAFSRSKSFDAIAYERRNGLVLASFPPDSQASIANRRAPFEF